MTKPFRIMKGEPVDPKHLRYPCWVFPKFNGFRGYGSGNVAFTASNKPFKNEWLQAAFNINDLDGEFVVGDPADGHNSLEKTSSVVTSQKPVDDLRFYVFDWLGNLEMPYGDRLRRLESLPWMLGNFMLYKVMRAPYEIAHCWEDVVRIERKYVAAGWEGVITRDPMAPYKCGKSTAIQAWMGKLKQFKDAEFKIVGWEERMHNGNEAVTSETGRTKRSTAKAGKTGRGDLGAFVCETEAGHQFGVGTGFTDDQRKAFWLIKEELVKNREYAKVRFHETGTKDVPLLPVFIHIRPKEDMTR